MEEASTHTAAKAAARQRLASTTRRGALGILAFWLALMGLMYLGFEYFLRPRPVSVTSSGDLVIPRARDGHFYAPGSINGQPVVFLVDTGASMVVVSEEFARAAGLAQGTPTTFNTANGSLRGRRVPDGEVVVGPARVSGITLGVGLVGFGSGKALLGQSFLSRFEVVLDRDQMLLRLKPQP